MTICRNSCLLGVFVLLASYSSSAMDNVVVPSSAAQPGKIFEPAVDPSLTGFSPLDPNGDGWITSTGVEFSDAIYEDSQEFENGDDWRVIWHYQGEPTNDLGTGATCGATEIVDNPNTAEHAAFFKIVDPDGDLSNRNEKLVFRIRVASESSGAFGYSILLDTDQSFGNDDANAVTGNPGFELEVLYGSGGGNSGVTLQDVDGKTSGFTELSHHGDGVRNQWSYAKFSNCPSDDPVFLDYYVDFADFPAGITALTPLRLVFASSSSPATALGGSASDIGGVDDGDPVLSNNDNAFTTVITNTPIVTFGTGYLPTGCTASHFHWSSAPAVSGNTASGIINGVNYTYTSSQNIGTTGDIFNHTVFPVAYNVPNQTSIQNTQATSNTLSFDSPLENPVLLFSSIGNPSLSVPIQFGSAVEVLWSQGVVVDSPTQITGTEGYAIVRFNGTFSSVGFEYTIAETWVNFTFGADFVNADADCDGIADYEDLDDDNDGVEDSLECYSSDFQWSSVPSFVGYTATGQINGVDFTYTSSNPIESSTEIWAHSNFPVSYGIPNQACVRNSIAGTNTIEFASPMENPVLVFASIGQNIVSVPIVFTDPVEILWSMNVSQQSPTQITGAEGYAIVRFSGTYSSISFNYLASEYYVNFTFGADFATTCDTDSDGVADFLDLDSDNDGIYDVVEGGLGGSDTDADGQIDSADAGFADANGNGMHDAAEGTTLPDSDADGLPNLREINSDNDSCNDVEEAGFTDDDGDGLLGPANPTFDSNGLVTSGTDGYTDPADVDASGTPDYMEASSTSTWYLDADGDGLGDASTSQSVCTAPSGYVSDNTDLCDDTTACNYDANSVTNASCTFVTTWYADADGDGLGDAGDSQSACSAPSGYVSDNTDLCDDTTACNYDANSVTNATCTFVTTWYADADGDGLGDAGDSQSACSAPSGYVSDSTDLCDDITACNYDANSLTNATCTFATTWYADADGDGLGDASDSQSACSAPSGYVSDSTDLCDDTTACNYDANSVTNTACTFGQTWYLDADGDGLGVLLSDSTSCVQPLNYVSDGTDLCDDTTACNYDANSVTNASCTFATTWYADADGDGLGDAGDSQSACSAPSGYVSDNTDLCDDTTACNYDANSVTNASCTFASTWYADADGDGLGDAGDSQSACSAPSGYVSDNTDLCDDTTACNYDANSVTNASCTFATTWYADADGDGLGDAGDSQSVCSAPSGYVSDNTDLCDDTTACNYDANSVTNATCTYGQTWYLDADGDGLGVLLSDSTSCVQPQNYVSDSTDNCDNLAAENYNAEGNPSCTFPASSLSDSLVICTGAEDLLIDLDTIHSYTGVSGYNLTTGFSGTYASAALNGSILTCDFSGEGTGADTLIVAATVGSSTQQLKIYIEEAMYPRRTAPVRALAASFPGANDGALEVALEGAYDDTVTVHFIAHPDQTLVNGLTQLPNEMYYIQGYTNVKGCTNLEPATSPLPPATPVPQRLMVPCVPCANHNTSD